MLLRWTHESNNTCTARKRSCGHIKSKARSYSVFLGLALLWETRNMIDICPLSLFHHQQGGNTIKSPVLPISSAYGLLKHPSHCTTGERKFVPCEVAALRPLLMLPFLELSSFPRSQAKLFLGSQRTKIPKKKAERVVICRQLRNCKRSV